MDCLPPFLTFFVALIYSSILVEFSVATETIIPGQSITDSQTLVSANQRFELGFFSPGNSTNKYLGLWYKTTPDIIVWVANRNNPVTDSQGVLTITRNGTLLILNATGATIWSSNSSKTAGIPIVQLLDTGNLVVIDDTSNTSSENYIWQGFNFPTDTRLPGMEMTTNFDAGLDRYLTSWKSLDDPSLGDFSYKIENNGLAQLVVSMGTAKKFRTGSWNGIRFSGETTFSNPSLRPKLVFNGTNLVSVSYPFNTSRTTRITVSEVGLLELYIMDENGTKWTLLYEEPSESCNNYGQCGPNGFCRINITPVCGCLKGFVPKSQQEWEVNDWSGGCVRNVSLNCQSDGFLKIAGVKLPDLLAFQVNTSMNLNECEAECLKNCSCNAYANSYISGGGSGCLMWFGDLVDFRKIDGEEIQQDIYIRLPASELGSNKKKQQQRLVEIIAVSAIYGLLIFTLVCGFIAINTMKKRIEKNAQKRKKEDSELPLFSLATIAAATNNFSLANLIGEGGFGQVYKGQISPEQEIAVKRLSKNSGQGIEEYKNEVVSIAKLQHRNLVRLLGCCIQGEERMLIYEYMHHKSLDHFIYDKSRRTSLDWPKRFDIVMGVARGLLYLHQDSRLRIIHRDLKASNILLDRDLNPKISDFGLARIFGGDQISAETKRVMGTYGYMSPEYAIDGEFSVKSDVFSLGVLLLEIVSGKRNRGFHHPDHHHNLLGHAWLLWTQRRDLELMDSCLRYSYIEYQVQRCIQVGLLCVQQHPQDRPEMSSILVMLGNEGSTLPQPKQPGFFFERSGADTDEVLITNVFGCTDDVKTITILEAR